MLNSISNMIYTEEAFLYQRWRMAIFVNATASTNHRNSLTRPWGCRADLGLSCKSPTVHAVQNGIIFVLRLWVILVFQSVRWLPSDTTLCHNQHTWPIPESSQLASHILIIYMLLIPFDPHCSNISQQLVQHVRLTQ